MTVKRELLKALNRQQLKSLAREFEVEFEHTWKKDVLVDAISRSHRLSSIGVEALATKITELGGNVPEAVRTERQDFFGQTAIDVFNRIEEVADELAPAIAVYEIIRPGYIEHITTMLDGLGEAKINSVGEVPHHVWCKFTGRQRGAYGTAKSLSYQIPKFVRTAIDTSVSHASLSNARRWQGSGLDSRVEYYVMQAFKAYVSESNDACIVMLARGLEHHLKGSLEFHSISYPKKATLGDLVALYKSNIGGDKALEKILEVANMDRIICAHDVEPYDKQMHKVDADHAWSAVEIALRDISIRPRG
ncbi:MAG: hypothetical protein MUO81_08225 [Thermoplasmata archaeon]|nr:hypothetical protein [Thermoplasmata archaeon]